MVKIPWMKKIFFHPRVPPLCFEPFWTICPARFCKWQGSNLKIEISSFHFSSSFCYNKIACYCVFSNLKITPLSPPPNLNTRHGAGTVVTPGYRLNIAREGFIYRGAQVYNKLDARLRSEPKLESFKTGLRKWVKTNIAVKPTPRFASISEFGSRRQHSPPPPPPDPPPRINTITRYFMGGQPGEES